MASRGILRTGRQRAASRRNLAKARKVRAHDTLTYWLKQGISAGASKATMGQAGKINTWVSGNYRAEKPKWYRDQSGRRTRKKR